MDAMLGKARAIKIKAQPFIGGRNREPKIATKIAAHLIRALRGMSLSRLLRLLVYWWSQSRTEDRDKNCRSSYPRFARDELVATSAIAPSRARDGLNEVKGHRGIARCWDKLSVINKCGGRLCGAKRNKGSRNAE